MFKSYIRREIAPAADSVTLRNILTMHQDLKNILKDSIYNKACYRDKTAFTTYLYVQEVYIGRIKYGKLANAHISIDECVSIKIFNACADNTRECMKAVQDICGNGSTFFAIGELDGGEERIEAIVEVWLNQFEVTQRTEQYRDDDESYIAAPHVAIKEDSDDHVVQFVKRAKDAVTHRTALKYEITHNEPGYTNRHLVKLDGNGGGGGEIYKLISSQTLDGVTTELWHLVFSWFVYPAYFVNGNRTKDILNRILNGDHNYSVLKMFPSPSETPDYGPIAACVN